MTVETLGSQISSFAQAAAKNLAFLFLSPVSHFSIWSLLCAFVIAFGVLVARRGGKPLRPSVAMRALFPKALLFGRSARADWGFLLLNGVLAPLLLGYAILSYKLVEGSIVTALTRIFGPLAPTTIPHGGTAALMSVTLFIAYEFGYWADHYLKHHIDWLWKFHRVHHTAETLSPVTNFRVHPVDSIVFFNLIALTMGAAGGALSWALGGAIEPWGFGGVNVLMLAFVFLLLHLQHSQLWITLPGAWGRIILGPAHHQIHHSSDPAHFNSNFGNSLAIWDSVFGTLRVPSKARERLKFGVTGLSHDPHTLTGTLAQPFVDAVRPLLSRSAVPQRRSAASRSV